MLSLILLSYYSGERITKVYDKLSIILAREKIGFELIVIDDGSTDNSFKIAQDLESRHENVKAFQLSKNFTSHYAIFAGLSICKGKCAMPIPDDEQQPYASIVDMYRIWEILRLGFSPVYYPYVRVKGINTKSRWTLRKKIRLFKDTFFSSSTWPVKVITNLGLFFSLFAFVIIVVYTYIRFFGNPDFWGERFPGWTSTIVIVSFFTFFVK